MPRHKSSRVFPISPDEIIKDYRLAYQSRQASIIGRREVLSGKAKFGIFGDGKELAQLAIARAFHKGDWRSGYYRDQTWMLMLGVTGLNGYFAQLYAHADVNYEPATAGRAMNGHFASRFLNPDGSWRNQTEMYNVAADVSPTAAQMPRAVGLAYASRLYRQVPELSGQTQFSHNGDEVVWATIGNASTAEGLFWESVNAIGVLKAPAVIAIYDDGYGISVPNQFQMVKENIGEILRGFERDANLPAEQAERGFDCYTVRAWDYPALLETFAAAGETARIFHIPALVHVTEGTQPQGHSTSGSQERYKSPERLKWEQEYDCLVKMREWLLEKELANEKELTSWEKRDRETVENARKTAWEAYHNPILAERKQLLSIMDELVPLSTHPAELVRIRNGLFTLPEPIRRDMHIAVHEALRTVRTEKNPAFEKLKKWKCADQAVNEQRYGSHLHSGTALKVRPVAPTYTPNSPNLMGFEVLNACFDAAIGRDPTIIAFGEDVGHLGDVNQGFRGLQDKFGPLRISDTGIREATILGQAIGMAMRGLRPIAEIQYLDYLLYALQVMSDDLANLYWRTAGGQKAPVIIRTRGHRLEGIWHSGSPMAGILGLVRGIYLLVPRDMTHAAGFYNTLFQSDEPAIMIEVLNGYRQKERLPDNIAELSLPLGVPEILRPGTDVTLVTYGACCRIALDAAARLARDGIETEVIDVQTLLPFDLPGIIGESLKKTSRILFVDEDVPGGASATMLQEVLEKQGGYFWLDSAPKTLTGSAHRPAYGSDGDYWSKPNAESIYDSVYEMMHEVDPSRYPQIY
ncbi:MAG TPA: thiamine pyrophosphate-dependent enzyme [Anaerolineales bacterium]|jgi:pyruvate/2-oxoglutarate/acetoin dehydrogenase E1 component/TPP-dependent pyruvate/acetoin dehydrogenase alpha subunit